MTNREKFKSVFGVSVEDLSEINWDSSYRKQKQYLVNMKDYGNEKWARTHEWIYVVASNKTDARKKAIEQLGSKYRRYLGSGRPMYALEISEVVEDGNDD